MKRREKNQSGGEEVTMKLSDGNGLISSRDPERKNGVNTMRVMGAFVACLMVSSVFFSLSVVLRDLPSDGVPSEERVLEVDVKSQKEIASGEGTSRSVEEPKDKLLGGLLTAGFDEQSCISRYGSVSYRKGSEHRPSTYLVSRLRSYEALHKQCGPNTESYNRAMDYLRLGNASAPPPSDYQFNGFGQSSPRCYGKMLKENSPNLANKLKPPSYLYLHLVHDYDDQDKLFFCEDDQSFLKEVPWLVMKTDNYFIPSLFLIPTFEEELNNLFPRKEMVFHFLGRYLFHPTDTVWGLIERYYRAYLSGFDKKIGIQIRVFDTGTGPFQHVLDQILACATREHLLPGVDKDKSISPNSDTQKSKAVLITSLSPGYLEQIRDLYWENPTITGEVVSVFQPSHEEYQQTEKQMHNQKAWAEMYLLSLTDVLITSSWSTFGYVAQGLGGLRPWILYKPENRTVPDPPCRRAMSMEPCFHAPPFYDCRAKRGIDTGELVPHVRHCEDMSWGLKLVDPSTD
ncbi:hypothetical protein CRG98_045855 [Punica granatum]|uniref:Fucosyltransferase n=1 Tax=Punica granatum TaxID=22663 RepID=A0A2I0HPW1_PUNGR|nr:hypothetical protein CRG98_045855 [Punica granatum]